jgi:hypothetical protein
MEFEINELEKNSVAIQTESCETFDIDINEMEFEKTHFFKHLSFANQSYFQHFRDSIKYSFMSFKASFCFFVFLFEFLVMILLKIKRESTEKNSRLRTRS